MNWGAELGGHLREGQPWQREAQMQSPRGESFVCSRDSEEANIAGEKMRSKQVLDTLRPWKLDMALAFYSKSNIKLINVPIHTLPWSLWLQWKCRKWECMKAGRPGESVARSVKVLMAWGSGGDDVVSMVRLQRCADQLSVQCERKGRSLTRRVSWGSML